MLVRSVARVRVPERSDPGSDRSADIKRALPAPLRDDPDDERGRKRGPRADAGEEDAVRQGDQLQRIALGTFQLKSVFGAKGDKSFRIGANIDGCISAKTVPVKVA